MRRHRGYYRGIILSIVGIILVGFLRLFTDIPGSYPGTLREVFEVFLYMFMISAWGISMRSRVMHKSIRRCLFGMAVMMGVWVFIREIKWHYAGSVSMERYLWYGFYIPMIEIPLLSFLAAAKIGQSEKAAAPRWEAPLHITAVLLIAMVLTNNFHEFVFRLHDPADLEAYSYGAGYAIVAAWIILLELATIVLIGRKTSGEKGKSKYLPLFFVLLLMGYSILYAQESTRKYVGFVELMVMFDWVMLVMWETCVMLGMIPVNKYYRQFFERATISARIVDNEGATFLSAGDAAPLEQAVLEKLREQGSVNLDNKSILQYHPISCGAVIWQENIAEIRALVDKLQSDQQELKDGNALEEEESRARIRESRISEKNRLYTLLYNEMREGLAEIRRTAEEIEVSEDIAECRRKLAFLNIIGTYLKRRSNFIILSEGEKTIAPEELELCLRETKKNLVYCGMNLVYTLELKGPLTGGDLLAIYDRFEAELKKRLFVSSYLAFTLLESEEEYELLFSADAASDGQTAPLTDLSDFVRKEVAADA